MEDDPASERSLELIQEWIDDCNDNHEHCRQTDLPQLPTRVLDLGEDELELRLFVTEAAYGRYATFSHRWGGEIPRRTTLDCFESYCDSIPLHTLPQSFQDAAKIAKNLSVRYLWIDALCIIQDSSEDWERECEKMCNIYRDSYITIAAPNAPNSEAGFLQRRTPPKTKAIRLPYYNIDRVLAGEIWFQVKQEHTGLHYNSLLQRGWILQEQLLSRRTLYFGTRQNYFECIETHHLETTGSWDYYKPLEGSPSLLLFPTSSSIKDAHIQWTKIIQAYSPRSLTYPADKLPALSGLARRFSQKTGCSYLAGHWRENLVATLAWYISDPIVRSAEEVFRAPSWSWASVDGKLGFINFVMVKSWDAKLVSDSMVLAGSDPFGQVLPGSNVVVRARVKIAEIWESPTEGSWSLFEISPGEFVNKLGSCNLDREFEVRSGDTLYCMQIARFRACFGHEPFAASAALLLRGFEVGKGMVYKRVGYMEVSRKGFEGGDGAEGEDWFEDGNLGEVCIV